MSRPLSLTPPIIPVSSSTVTFPVVTGHTLLRSDKVKHIFIFVTEDWYVTDIHSATVFAEIERVLRISLIDEIVLDEKSRIERYTSQS